METIESFCDRHDACTDGKKWASENCSTMNDVWECAKPSWLIWVATRPGVVDDKTLRLFACWCVRQVWHLLKDERSRNAVLTAEKYTRGSASEDELFTAWKPARTAVPDTNDAEPSVWHATYAAMWVAWNDAAGSAWTAACEAALSTAWAARVTSPAAYEVAWNATREDQAKWLRENAKPNFEVVLKKSEAVK